MEHINQIFEAPNDEESLRAVDTAFSRSIEASVNGKPIQYQDIQGMVLSLRTNSNLKVLWQRAQELPDDATTNQVSPYIDMSIASALKAVFQSGKFHGSYIIRGIQRTLPGSNRLVEFERRKTVEVEYVDLFPESEPGTHGERSE
jgi:hypothetical protein